MTVDLPGERWFVSGTGKLHHCNPRKATGHPSVPHPSRYALSIQCPRKQRFAHTDFARSDVFEKSSVIVMANWGLRRHSNRH